MRVRVVVDLTATSFDLDDLSDDMAFPDLLALLELESNVPGPQMQLFVDDKEVHMAEARAKTLGRIGIHQNSVLALLNTNITEAEMTPTALEEMLTVRTQLRSNPYDLSTIKQNNPPFAEAIESPVIAPFACALVRQQHARTQRNRERARQLAALEANPFDIEAQRAIQEEIDSENIESLRQEALEHMPESFGSVVMLYVNVRVNGVALKAFVDSGAQMTIMSSACAERCGITRLIDQRFQGMAVGVGSQKILGRVHMYAVEIAGCFLPTSFSILEQQPMDMLLGLDMLRRHQCVLDLRTNELVIGTTGARAKFLDGQDLPDHVRRQEQAEDEGGAGAAAAPAPAGAGGARPGPGTATATTYPETAVKELMDLGGFSRMQAMEALAVCDGDVQRAASYLLEKCQVNFQHFVATATTTRMT